MVASLLVGLLAAAAPTGKTLWLVEPLYPGQEQLVGRTEQALRQLVTPEDRASHVIGKTELVAFLQTAGKPAPASGLGCVVDASCKDPLDSLVKSYGFDRVQLIRSGQDESGYRVRLTTFRPGEGAVSSTEGSNPALDKALLGAVVKVDQLISSLEIVTTPPGATVYVDNEKLGVTPLTTQVLPGERTIKISLPGYLPIEMTQEVQVRGVVKLARQLEKVPARLIADVKPDTTDIAMDGRVLGQGHLDLGIQPGPHTLRLSKRGYVPYEVKADIKPGETFRVEKTLAATPWESFRQGAVADQEYIYSRTSYFDISFELLNLNSDRIAGRRFGNGDDANATTSRLLQPGSGATLMGISAEYGIWGRYFGVALVGFGYTRNTDPWRVSVLNPTPGAEEIEVVGDFLHLRALQPQVRYALWRFVLSIQVGLEVVGGRLLERATPQTYSEGFAVLDLEVSGRASIKAYIVAGLYAQAAWRYTYPIVGFRSSANELASGFRGWSFGLGYAF